MKKPVDLIGAELGWGARLHEVAWGPRAVQESRCWEKLGFIADDIRWRTGITPKTAYQPGKILSYAERIEEVRFFDQHLADEVSRCVEEGHFPLVVGGDHAMAIGTWSGVVRALKAPRQFGLIWLDAHMDSHTMTTTPSQAIHGMPLAVLMGHGEPALVDVAGLGAKLDPKHVVLIGVRSFESGEAELLKRLNVTVYFMEDIKDIGISKVLEKAIDQVKQGTRGFGVSVDLDVFDPTIAPGVGSPAAGGLFESFISQEFSRMVQDDACQGFEIAEYNPTRDESQKTLNLIQTLIQSKVR